MFSSLLCRLPSALRRPGPAVPRSRFAHTHAHHSPRPRRGVLTTLSFAAALGASSYTLGALAPPAPLSLLFPRPAPPPPAPSSPEAIAHALAIEAQLQTLPLLVSLRRAPDADAWYEARPYARYPEERRVNNLTAGALRGAGRIAVSPVVRARKDETEGLVFVHVGRGLCGHDGIVHGGLLATLLDEALARTAINNLPDKIGVTANLSLNYRAPTKADQFIVIRTTLVEKKGRKAVVSGRVEDMEGTVLVEATATFVQPRYAKLLSTSAIKSAMGEPEAAPPQVPQ